MVMDWLAGAWAIGRFSHLPIPAAREGGFTGRFSLRLPAQDLSDFVCLVHESISIHFVMLTAN